MGDRKATTTTASERRYNSQFFLAQWMNYDTIIKIKKRKGGVGDLQIQSKETERLIV